MPPAVSNYKTIRWVLTWLAIAVVVVTLTFTLRSISNTSVDTGLADIKYNELTSESIKGRVEFSRSLFQIGLLITAALWALVIAKPDEIGIVFADRQEVLMFLCASLLLIGSLVDHSLYLNYVSRVFLAGGRLYDKDSPSIPDVFDANINNFYQYQIIHLALGAFIAVVTLFSAHNLKEKP
ncbi:MAG TPA: hypothetical protein VFY61_14345 [Pyrinomonadaceae bacterium]|nr:hypothetical protein [Pyrinomonadaceae bacterium]